MHIKMYLVIKYVPEGPQEGESFQGKTYMCFHLVTSISYAQTCQVMYAEGYCLHLALSLGRGWVC